MSDYNFEKDVIEIIKRKILTDIFKTEFIKVDYSNRYSIPTSFLTSVYNSLDLENIKKKLIERLENEMADKIANKMITEYSNDIKQIMSNKELREELRNFAKSKIEGICNKTMIDIKEEKKIKLSENTICCSKCHSTFDKEYDEWKYCPICGELINKN